MKTFVIIPICNVEKYVEYCIRFIINSQIRIQKSTFIS